MGFLLVSSLFRAGLSLAWHQMQMAGGVGGDSNSLSHRRISLPLGGNYLIQDLCLVSWLRVRCRYVGAAGSVL